MLVDKDKATVLLDHVSWEYYTHTLSEIGHGAVRIVYDRGRMEIMTVSNEHERFKKIAARLLEIYGLENRITLEGFGSVTLHRRDIKRGLEPDECYYITSTPPPLSNKGMDIKRHAPPALAIEVEITQGTISKRSIYSKLGVPELWRWSGQAMHVLHRQETGEYVEVPASRYVPD